MGEALEATKVGDNIRKAGQKIDELAGKTGDRTDDIIHRTAQKAEDWKREFNEYSDELVNYVTKNPIKSTLIAAGIGMVLGLILKNSRR